MHLRDRCGMSANLFPYFRFASSLAAQNYRRTDPVTSKEAGRAARKFISTDQSEILRALTSRPMAAEEVSDFLGWNDSVRACRRFADMIRAGLIERTIEKHINRNGRSAFRHRRVVMPGEVLPDWDDLRGVAPNATGDLSSEAFVRELRDGWDRT